MLNYKSLIPQTHTHKITLALGEKTLKQENKTKQRKTKTKTPQSINSAVTPSTDDNTTTNHNTDV